MRLIDFREVPDLELQYPLFFQKNYADYERTKGWEVKIFTDGSSYMPVKLKKTRFIKQGQYLYPPMIAGKRLTTNNEEAFLTRFITFCKNSAICDFIIPPLHYSLFAVVPKGSYFTPLGIIVVNLQKTDDELFKAFSSNYRNEIRKAQNENIEVVFDNSFFTPFYNLYKNTHLRQGIYFDSEQELRNLTNSLGEKSCAIAVVKKGDEIYGAALVLVNGSEAYYFQSGAAENCPYPGANKLLQLEIMKWLKGRGVTRYVMGGYRQGNVKGTKYEGIQKFKLRFGAEVEEGFHFYTQISWRYTLYKNLLQAYLTLRKVKQNQTGLNYTYN